MMVRRDLSDETTEVNFNRIESLIDDGRRALDRISTVRRYHTSARKCIDQATGQVGELASELEVVLDTIANEIRR